MLSTNRRMSSHDVDDSYHSSTFDRDVEIRVHETVGSASVSPSGRDVVLASAEGLHIVDLDSPYTAPRYLSHQQQWPPADVQWSPFAARDYWIVSTSNQKALVWNLELYSAASPIQYTLHAHDRAITDINFSAHHPDMLATCAVDSFVHCWDLREAGKPAMSFADWSAGATQVKWNRQDEHILASSHDKFLHIWDNRKGAYPLKTIEAHTTKIYGIDWNRIRATGILTCSLDQSIKFWDYSKGDDKPERVIRTLFPVWRARHTPFGWGVLALPQRGDNDLHMYDRRLSKGTPRIGFVDPVHSFSGHQSNVKEFLWRSRGSIDHGVDNRDFQLISWGMDRVLHLHRVDPSVLKTVGYQKGQEMRKNMPVTRQGARYRTFNIPKPIPLTTDTEELSATQSRGLLGKLVSAAGMSKMPPPVAPVGREQASMTYSGKLRKRTADPIKWMQGVTMRSRTDTMSKSNLGLDNPESLKDEITTVSQKYTKVDFEIADVHGRVARVALNGPWGPDDRPVFLRVTFEFPSDYPSVSPAICSLERTAAGMSDEIVEKLTEEMKTIVNHYHGRKMGCLEAVITYLLGERGLEESITLPPFEGPYDLLSPAAESSSDDDDDAVDGQDLETSAEGALGPAQANVPLPKACGAYWSNDGRLVCFFPPKPEPKPLFSLEALRSAAGEKFRGHRHLEGFGRMQEDSPSSKRRTASVDDDETEDSAESWTSSSSSSDDSFDDISRLPSRFHPPAAWRAATLRMQKTSSHSGSGGVTSSKRDTTATKNPTIVSIHDFSDMLPARRDLAEEYLVFGSGPDVCLHNAKVCQAHGLEDHAITWDICRHLLLNEVPLENAEQNDSKTPIFVEAKRQMVRVRRKDSGLDLALDKPANVANPILRGRVKWGGHPFGSPWLIPELFEYYERLADTQMLAMLACIFYEPEVCKNVSYTLAGTKSQDLPLAMQAPAYFLEYSPSVEVARSLAETGKVTIQSATPSDSRSGGPQDYFDRNTTFGSAGSSNGPWERDTVPSGPHTPYSTGDTPPPVTPYSVRSNRNSSANSLSTSPEQTSNRSSRRSTSNMSAAFSLTKAFTSLSTSPTTQERFKASDADLSTSAPTAQTSSVTWGSTTFYSSNSPTSAEKRRRSQSSRRSSSRPFAVDGANDTEEDDDEYDTDDTYYDVGKVYAPTKKEEQKFRVVLKNQSLFDVEGHASVPLLPPKDSVKFRAYRDVYAELLGSWGLYIQRAELVKFNGLTNFWSEDAPVYPLHVQMSRDKPEQASKLSQRSSPMLHGRDMFDNLEPSKKILDMNTAQSRSHGSRSWAPSRKSSDLSPKHNKRNLHLEKSLLNGPIRFEPKKRAVPGINCHICIEIIHGLFVSCPSGRHKAHTMCYEDSVDGKSTDEMSDMGVSCGCKTNDIEDWLSSDMDIKWSSFMEENGLRIGPGCARSIS
ncbi:uncharacterized protein PV09_00255 [Verruconis gallopava]|uniref:RWD domain-containing protein n=1 Tax=Verruconis gallopava TaxID=253628 RepID=A0A0D1Z8L8_9PEZI|nr:uncharacterized protein PV09_00255 [Verruconis gallopava]KIW09357.1 hypothetical protein PV09_00255 [Verruconis gallopava]